MYDSIVLQGYDIFWIDGIASVEKMNIFYRDLIVDGWLMKELFCGDSGRKVHDFCYFFVVSEVDFDFLLFIVACVL